MSRFFGRKGQCGLGTSLCAEITEGTLNIGFRNCNADCDGEGEVERIWMYSHNVVE